MAAQYKILPGHGLKVVHIDGYTDLAELRGLAIKYRADPDYRPDQCQLIDLGQLKRAKARFLDVLTLRNHYNRTFGPLDKPIMVAIFAPTDLGYGLSRMFSAVVSGSKLMTVKIFSDRPSALDWLSYPGSEREFEDALSNVAAVV